MDFQRQSVGFAGHAIGLSTKKKGRRTQSVIDKAAVPPVRPPPLTECLALVEIKPLSLCTGAAVDAVLDAAFGTDRHSRTAYRVRAGTCTIDALSFAAFDGGALVGTLQSWPVRLETAAGDFALVMVGPVAVLPDRQRSGVGRLLMDAMLAAADTGADGALMLVGDPEYYGRFFGFSADATGGWQLPGPVERHRLLARAANGHEPPPWTGMVLPDPARG